MVVEIKNLQDFIKLIGNENGESGPAIIDFTAQWCGPCKTVAPKFSKLAELYSNVKLFKIDVDNPETEKIVSACQVTSMPTFCFFNNGQYIDRVIVADITQIESKLKQHFVKQ